MVAIATAPERKARQRQSALDRANVIRLARADLKRRVRTGAVTVCELLKDPPEALNGVRLAVLLDWQPRWGVDRSERALRLVRPSVSPRTLVGELSPQRRLVFARMLKKGTA